MNVEIIALRGQAFPAVEKKEAFAQAKNLSKELTPVFSACTMRRLGSWTFAKKEVQVFFSPLGLEALVLHQNSFQEKIPSERIKGGINGAMPRELLWAGLKNSRSSFFPVITGSIGSSVLTFLPRLEGAALDQESKMQTELALIRQKLSNSLKNSSDVGVNEFKRAIEFTQELSDVVSAEIPWDLLIQALEHFQSIKRGKGDLLEIFTYSEILADLFTSKGKALTAQDRATHVQKLLEIFQEMRKFFHERDEYLQEQAYLTLSLVVTDSLEKQVALLFEGGELALDFAQRSNPTVASTSQHPEVPQPSSFQGYEDASVYFAAAYRLAQDPQTKTHAFTRLCEVQGAHLKGHIPGEEETLDLQREKYIHFYKARCSSGNLQELSLEGKKLLVKEIENCADYLAACGYLKLSYYLYDMLSEQFKTEKEIDVFHYRMASTDLGCNAEKARDQYLQKLELLRQEIEHIRIDASNLLNESSLSLEDQKEINGRYRKLMKELFNTCALILDPQGKYPYALMVVGSLARHEMCPYSDFEVALLLEKEEHRPHFRKVAELFHLLIISLGETKLSIVGKEDTIKQGFSLDKYNNPLRLCGTGDSFIQRQMTKAEDPVQLNVLRTCSFLTGSQKLFDEYNANLTKALNTPLDEESERNWRQYHALHLVEQSLIPAYKYIDASILSNPGTLDIKENLLRFCVFSFESLCLYYGIPTDCHTLEKITLLCEKGLFPKALKKSFQEYLAFLFRLRWKNHLHFKEECDDYTLELAEKEIVVTAYQTLLKPLKDTLVNWLKEDTTLQDPTLFSTAYFEYAEKLFYNREFDSAFIYLQKATALKEDLLYDKFSGQLYFYQGRFTEAKEAWHKVQIFIQEKLASITAETSFSFEKYSQEEELLRNLVNLAEEQEAVQVALKEAFENIQLTISLPFSQQETSLEIPLLNELPSQNFLKIWEKSLTLWLTAILRRELTPQDLLSSFKNTYLKLPKIYRKEVRRQVLTQFSDRLPLLQDFYCEEGYLFSAWSKRHHWLKKLHNLLVKKENPNCSTSFVSGLYTPQGYLHKEVEKKLFQRGEVFQRAISWGNRSVNQTQEVFFKKDPESPGDEYAVFLLNHLITGQGSPPVEMLGVLNKKPHLLLASEAIKGEPLHLFLAKHPEAVSKIDHKQFSQMVLMALLIDPEDGKADNYIAQYTQNSQGAITNVHIIGVDNDHVFVKPFVQKGLLFQDPHLFIKTILFCFDQMKEPLHSDVVNSYLELDVTAILEEWLEMLCDYNMRIEKLLDKNTLNHYWGEKILIPFFMHPDQVLYLLEKMIRLQQALKQSEKVKTSLDLLKLLNPRLAATYGPPLHRSSSPLKRFELITKDAYKRAGGATFTITTTCEIKQYTFKDSLKSIEEFKAKGFTPQESMRILSRLADHKRYKELTDKPLDSLQQDLKNILTTPYQEELLEKQDWSKVSLLDLPTHLGKFAKVPLRRVNLSHCAALTDDLLVSFIEGCRHPITEEIEVQRLYLQGCTSLTSKVTNAIKKCTRLKILGLQDTSIEKLEISKSLSFLTLLDLKGCKKLTFLEVQGPLKRLSLQGCTQMQKLYLYCPKLKSLLLKDVSPNLTYWASKETPISESVFRLLKKAQMDEEFSLEVPLNEIVLEIFEWAIQENTSLKKLSINLLNIATPSPRNISNLIQKIATMKNLPELDLKGCPGLQGDQVELLIKELSLEKLTLPVFLLDYKNSANQTLLHLAVIAQNWKLAEHFISQETLLHIQDNKGNTPLDIARRISPEMRILLERAVFVEDVVFGRYDWVKYFGEIGEQPPLPEGIWEILQSPCPIWPNKKVVDTHLLTLIPQTVNGKPLTLDYLEELIQNPKGRGKATKYSSYNSDVKNAIGRKAQDRSYWVLLTKDVLPNTRNKDYEDQCRELENWKKKFPAFQAGGYRVAKAIEVATSVLMEHVRSGTRFYSGGVNEQWTCTRCSETSTRGIQVLIGGLADSGLVVRDEAFVHDFFGLGVAREVLGRAVFVEDVVFGRYDWVKYFGEIGEQPPLPEGIWEILQSPCPIWPNKKVVDTHLLTLIPQTVNGKPLTLDYLGELVQNPKGRGKATKYSSYNSDVKNAIGRKAQDRSYWVLLTKDVLPNTRNKDYAAQCRELENWKKKSPAFQAGGYRVAKAIEVATSVLMEHVRSGTRFYSGGANEQWTYTRCSETSTRGVQVLVGGLAASGLVVRDEAFVLDCFGLGGAREV